MTETTPERPLPNANSPVHGLFSYTIADILSQSTTALTYRELALRVIEQYRAMPRLSPTPLFEGGGLDRQILGQRSWPERPQMLLAERIPGGEWALRAGAVHGLTVGSILELFPPAGSAAADARIGFVKVTSVEPTSARVVPTTFDSVAAPAPARLAVASRARVRYHEFGSFRLRVALQQPGSAAAPGFTTLAPGQGPAVIERAMSDLTTSTNGLAERVSTPAADWFVRPTDGRAVLAPSEGWQATTTSPGGTSGPPPQFVIGAANDPKTAASLSDALRRIGRARNLMRLASAAGQGPRVDLVSSAMPMPRIQPAGRCRATRRCHHSCRRVCRVSYQQCRPAALDVTVLYVDAAFGIQPIYPQRDREVDNQLKPGETRIIGRFRVTDDPLGWESAVAIAVESTPARQNFSMLAQDSLETRRGDSTTSSSPLLRLLESAMFGSEAQLGTERQSRDVCRQARDVAYRAGCEVTGLQEERVRFRTIGIVVMIAAVLCAGGAAQSTQQPAAAASAPSLEEARRLQREGEAHIEARQYKEAAEKLDRALSIRRQALGEVHPDVAQSMERLGIVALSQGDYARAEQLVQNALKIREATLSANDVAVGESLVDLGTVYQLRGDFVRPEPLYQRALSIYEKAASVPMPSLAVQASMAEIHGNLGVLYQGRGDLVRAVEHLARALAIQEGALGPDHPAVARAAANLAGGTSDRGRTRRPSSC